MLTTLTGGKNQIKDEVSLTLLGAPRESIELSPKKNQEGRDVFCWVFFIPSLILTVVCFCGIFYS